MRRSRRAAMAVAFALCFLLSSTTTLVAARPIGPGDLMDIFASIAGQGVPLLRALDGSPQINTGSDGRLTFLLLGSDARGNGISRTDTIMIMSLKGNTISAASIPRDTKGLPNPFAGGGKFGKVNSTLRLLLQSNGYNLDVALAKFQVVIEKALQIEIDYDALIWFGGFTTLVDQVDGGSHLIKLNIPRSIYDSRHHDQDSNSVGVYFPKATDYQLNAWNPSSQTGSPYCNGAFKKYADPSTHPSTWCKRALPFVRTRHGSSDWARAGRQQRFIDATIDAVDSDELANLVSTALGEGHGKWETNFPITMENATDLYNALQGASLLHSVVFKPGTYATHVPGSNAYELKLPAVRAWCNTYMN